MKRASYREGVWWIALNDGSGDSERLDPAYCAEMVSACLLADLFGTTVERVGRDVVRYRKQHDKAQA